LVFSTDLNANKSHKGFNRICMGRALSNAIGSAFLSQPRDHLHGGKSNAAESWFRPWSWQHMGCGGNVQRESAHL
jgi:hypothetical protein